VSRVIDAPAGRIFALLTDPAMHPRLDGSGSVLAARPDGPDRLELGAKFGMDMRLGTRYKIENTVVEYEPDRLIAWRHFNGHRWRWRLNALDDHRTEVTETFDWSTARVPILISLSGFPRRNRRAIQQTLDRLPTLVGG